ncbi:unnamed protein product [Angiostrongylus costaricensis]|uniref:Domain of unknown function DB domain-containing protein n=1 Tax=Angiostrongylus costaricensis TaxID=334426 RepID=A0A3P7H6C6_ANGCS|nr:unnamed protein product [Angiostrongylus costaricensis]
MCGSQHFSHSIHCPRRSSNIYVWLRLLLEDFHFIFSVVESWSSNSPYSPEIAEPERSQLDCSIFFPDKSDTNFPTPADERLGYPNKAFLSCCKSVKVAKSCERICNFDILNKKTLTGMFLGTDPCPQSYGLDLLQCAAQSQDHTTCCHSRGVQNTSAGDKCLGFCNMRPGVNFQADVSMLPCWAVLNDIKTCFEDYIRNS